MRKIITLFAITILSSTCMWAWNFKSGDLFYNITSNSTPYTVEVTYQMDNSTNYSGLVSVNIPKTVSHNGQTYTVKSIGTNAFRECTTLKSISIPSSVKRFGKNAFYNCKSLQVTNYMGDIAGWCRIRFSGLYSNPISQSHRFYIKDQELKNVVLPATDTIPAHLFDGCTSIKSITIPAEVKYFGSNAFIGCNSLQKTNYLGDIAQWCAIRFDGGYANPICQSHNLWLNGEEVKELAIPNTVDSIGNNQFDCCASITSVDIPNSVTYIGNGAFYKCSSLTTITIPSSVTTVEDRAFSGCDSLVTLTVEEGNTVYDSRNNCNAIIETATNTLITGCKNTTIPNSVTRIGNEAFEGCSGLTSVNIGNGVKNIYEQAFANCAELTDVYCYAENVPTTQSDAFYGSYTEYATLHVPAASIEQYKTASPWINFGTIVPLTDEDAVAEVQAVPVLIQTQGNSITVEGAEAGTEIILYGVNGVQLDSVIATTGVASLNASRLSGSVAIVKIGNETVKVLMKQ